MDELDRIVKEKQPTGNKHAKNKWELLQNRLKSFSGGTSWSLENAQGAI